MEDKRFELRAELVTVEISDPQTGEIFRRELPIEYYETPIFFACAVKILTVPCPSLCSIPRAEFKSSRT